MNPRYCVENSPDPLESLVLRDRATDASVTLAPARGGMVTRFTVGAVPVLALDEATLRDPGKNVRGGIPVLFPIAGRLHGDAYEARGARFAMKQHGFARNKPWQLTGSSADEAHGARATLALHDDAATRAQYPFAFALAYTYALRDGALSLTQRIENRDTAPMPARPGLHPYFTVRDQEKPRAHLDTNATRAFDNRTGAPCAVPSRIDFAVAELDLHLLDHGPRTAVLERPPLPAIELRFGNDQGVLVLWTLAEKDFVCVEPWTAPGGALGAPGDLVVPPGGAHETTLTIRLRD